MKYFMATIMLGFGAITMASAYKARRQKNDLPSAAIFTIVGSLAIFIDLLTWLFPGVIAQALQD